MARINRTDVIQRAVNGLALSTATDKIPNECLDKVQLTYDLNINQINFIDDTSSAVTSSGLVIYTCSADKDTYLWGISATWQSDVTADNTTLTVSAKLFNGSSAGVPVLRMNKFTTTATLLEKSNMFAAPIRLLRGSTITLSNTFSVGASTSAISLFLEEKNPSQ